MSVQEVIPGQPLFTPLLSADEYEHGNVRKDFKGYTVTIDPEAAEAIPKGARDNRKGLLYDKSWPGFDRTQCCGPMCCVLPRPVLGSIGSSWRGVGSYM